MGSLTPGWDANIPANPTDHTRPSRLLSMRSRKSTDVEDGSFPIGSPQHGEGMAEKVASPLAQPQKPDGPVEELEKKTEAHLAWWHHSEGEKLNIQPKLEVEAEEHGLSPKGQGKIPLSSPIGAAASKLNYDDRSKPEEGVTFSFRSHD